MTDDEDNEPPAFETTKRDLVVSGLKGAVGMVPFAGSILVEIIGHVIPEQRAQRLESYVLKLGERLDEMENEFDREGLKEPEAVNLFEEGAFQASRATSEERLSYITRLVANGMAGGEKATIEARRLLNLLRSVDDDQVLILASHSDKYSSDSEFLQRHSTVLDPVVAHLQSSRDEVDAETVYTLSRNQLVSLNLLAARFKRPKKGEMPEFDAKTGMLKAASTDLTLLGRMLLSRLGLIGPDEF